MLDPKRLLLILALSSTAACGAFFERSAEVDPAVKAESFYSLTATDITGQERPLDQYAGQVALVVNTASQCGFTPQYADLQAIYDEYAEQGFVVLGFPSNDFGGQEPGTRGEIAEFCSSNYGVTFPLFDKVVTKQGDAQSPVYGFLGGSTGSLPGWNFGKYLVGRDGSVIGFWDSRTKPTGETLRAEIERALAQG
jgi:glutathione peroxidase